MQSGFQATKDLGDPAGIFMGERKYFLHFCTIPPRLSVSSVFLFFLGTLANSQGPVWFWNASCLVGLPLFTPLLTMLTIVGWFTLVENSQWCWTLVIHHYIYRWKYLRLIRKEKITAKMKRFWHLLFHTTKDSFFKLLLNFHTFILLLLQIILGLQDSSIKRRDTGGVLSCC